jgi:hypothetical protein
VPDAVIESQMGYRPKDQIRVYQHPSQLPHIVGPMIDKAMEISL